MRELDERLGLSALIAEHLADSHGKNTQLPMADLLRQARYYWLLLAEGHLTRRRFGAMLGRIALLPILTG